VRETLFTSHAEMYWPPKTTGGMAAVVVLAVPVFWMDFSHRLGEDDAVHQEKWRLALGLLDTLTDWRLKAPVVVADAGYGVSTPFRTGLEERGLAYVLALTGKEVAHPESARPDQPA
jgi:SRSO17 transposase